MDKTALRTVLSHRLDAIDNDELRRAEEKINERLVRAVDWSAVRTLHIYSAQAKWHEVELAGFVSWLSDNHPHISITRGLPEPDASLPGGIFDVIIVPLLGFDNGCRRLGRGRGWYDNFLGTQSQAVKMGIALDIQRLNTVPMEPHDVPLDSIITETATYRRQISAS